MSDAQTDVAALVEKMKYIAAILDANAEKFAVPDHIPAKAKTVREAAATLESHARELAEARARILELETVTDEQVERACIAYAAASGGEWEGVRDRHKPIWRKAIRAALMAGR